MSLEDAIFDTLRSVNVPDRNLEPANVVDVLAAISVGVSRLAEGVMPSGLAHGTDEMGGTVRSLTEAVMGVTAGLSAVASSIESLAEAVREHE